MTDEQSQAEGEQEAALSDFLADPELTVDDLADLLTNGNGTTPVPEDN